MISDLTVIREKGFDALSKELGVSGMAVFIRQLENGSGDYTSEREETLKGVSIDDIVSSIAERKCKQGFGQKMPK